MDNNDLLQAISSLMDNKLEPINNRLDKIKDNQTILESKVDDISVKQGSQDIRLRELSRNQTVVKQDVKGIKSDVSEIKVQVDAIWQDIALQETRLEKLTK